MYTGFLGYKKIVDHVQSSIGAELAELPGSG
jgi:hypothetical protein